jgi:hypothetical protein
LDVRDQGCRISVLRSGEGGLWQTASEPALLRRAPAGDGFSHWGRRALAWKHRLPLGQVIAVFPAGHPADTSVARFYLKRFHETYLAKKGVCKVHLLEEQQTPWIRQLWQETLEDSAFALQGFLQPWQHDILLAKPGQPELGMSPYLHFQLGDQMAAWKLIQAGEVAAQGSDARLCGQRIVAQVADFLRRRVDLEVGEETVRGLLQASCQAALRRPESPSLSLAGRQLHSGLPTRQTFAWTELVAGKPAFVQAWRSVKRRIFAQAEALTGRASGNAEGLDLPGWRVLPSGPLAQLFVEGPAVSLMDGKP